jgi:adenosine deaminase-related growth factor
MKKSIYLIILLEYFLLENGSALPLSENANALPLPFNEYSFVLGRNYLKSLDSTSPRELTDKEKVVRIYFEKLKVDEFSRTGLSGFYPLKPLETILDSIVNSELYAQLKFLPKGGNLHMHEDQMANRRQLLEIIKSSEEYDYLYICDKTKENCIKNICNCTDYFLTYIKNSTFVKDGWVKVKDSNWTVDAILNKTTLTGILNNLETKLSPTDSSSRWKATSDRGFFGFFADLIVYNKTRFDYLKACLDKSLEENVQLIEFRRPNFDGLYYFDKEGNRVTLPINDEIDRLLQFKKDYISKNPKFIDFNYIIFGVRVRPKEDILNDLKLAISIQKQYPSFIRGYDLVAEEDQGHSLLFHANALISGFNYSYTSSNDSFGFYFHNAETNWPTDMMPPQLGDDTSTSNNVYDAIVFNTHRIGHGLGYIKHPNLYPYLRERNIAIEVCPASNQILGML